MSQTKYMELAVKNEVCRDEQRRVQVRAKGRNGLDYVELQQAHSTAEGPETTTLKVFFIGPAPASLTPANFGIDGGVRIRDIRVADAERVSRGEDDLDDYWLLTLNRFGDFSPYTLRVAESDAKGRPGNEPLPDFDRRYSRLEFTFKADCPTTLDCLPQTSCSPPDRLTPEINYLAKDYSSFRQLILDRLALLMPDWKERHVPDLGITLIELLAYVGDYLSYYQDAVGTEAYLNTACERISIRRHTRLIDYFLHEGCNARTWVAMKTGTDEELDLGELYFITGFNETLAQEKVVLSQEDLRDVPPHAYEVFEPMDHRSKIDVYKAHNEMKFYTWGDRECCLPRGATRATLVYEWKNGLFLRPGDVLIFVERKGAKTGAPADANPLHRHAVRLTSVTPAIDDLSYTQIVEIEWSRLDALPFPLCLSSIGPTDDCCEEITCVSVALGNVVLVDHGRIVDTEDFTVGCAEEEDAGCEAIGQPRDPVLRPAPFKPALKFGPVTHREPFPRTEDIARSQARFLSELPNVVHQMVDALWRKAQGGQMLTDNELGALEVVFSRRAMIEVGLLSSSGTKWLKSPNQAGAIAALIANEDRWLVRKGRRLAILRSRAEAGYELNELAALEISEMFGRQFGQTLLRSNSVLFGPASASLQQDPQTALPAIEIDEVNANPCVRWEPRRDLLDSDGDNRHFVAEIDEEGVAQLRFGNGELGRAPAANARFTARYRVGNGKSGNVGTGAISHVVFRRPRSGLILRPSNPLAAGGGVEPETTAEARMFAPGTFRKQLKRAIVSDDYKRLAERNQKIQRAAAALHWTGSWVEASVAIDPKGGEEFVQSLRDDIERYLGQYRRMGHDLRITEARYVPLEIELRICVLPHYLRGFVEASLLDVFSNRLLPDGRRGLFHPDNLTFGDDIYLSTLIAAARAVTGVEDVQVIVFKRLFESPNHEIENGVLPLNEFEIAQLDSDPNYPERGKLTLRMSGGR